MPQPKPTLAPNFMALLDQVIRETYLPAIQAQLDRNIWGFDLSGQGSPLTPEQLADRQRANAEFYERRAVERAKWATVMERTKRALLDMPEWLRDELIDDVDDSWDD